MFSWSSRDALVVGKPYGALAYHLAWGDGLLAPLTGYDKNTMFVDATLANCLGVAAGLCMSKKFKNVVCVVGDGCLQEGTILEAASFCGRCKSTLTTKLILAIDCNG
jgi:transketolase N-terminal domain/subunit